MRRITVYKAQLPWATQALRMLRDAGLDASFVHVPSPIVQQKAGHTLKLEVAVPSVQVEDAQRLLHEWERDAVERTGSVGARLARDLVLSLLPPAVLIGVTLILYREVPDWVVFPSIGLWLAAVIVIGRLQRNRE